MMKIQGSKRGLVRRLGLAAGAALVLSATSYQRAEALSLINPAAAPAAKYISDGLTTEVRGGHGGGGHGGGHGGGGHGMGHGGFHGGGVAVHGGGFRGGGAAVRSGGFHTGHIFRGGFHHGRFAFRHRFHRRFFFAPVYYDYPAGYCRTVWTYDGPRRICGYRAWYRHHWRHHWRHRWHHRW